MKDFGETISAVRKRKGLSRIEVAEKMTEYGFNTNENMLGKWERNYCQPNAVQFLALCEVLDINDINTVFQVAEKQNPEQVLNEEGMERVKEYIRLLSQDAQFVSAVMHK